MGLVIVGLSLGSFEGIQSSLFYLFIYIATAILGFSVLSIFNKELEFFAGIPPLLGFLGK